MKILLISAVFGGIDYQRPLPHQTIPIDRIFVNEGNSPVPLHSLEPRMKAKYFKMQTHRLYPHYDAYIWIDGNVSIRSRNFAAVLASNLNGYDIVIRKHPERDCIYTEAQSVMDGMKNGDKYLIRRYATHPLVPEANSYRLKGYPEHAGLYWCGCFMRWNNARVNLFFDHWWDKTLQWSSFDQLSFPYLVMEHKMDLRVQEWAPYYKNELMEIVAHVKIQ